MRGRQCWLRRQRKGPRPRDAAASGNWKRPGIGFGTTPAATWIAA